MKLSLFFFILLAILGTSVKAKQVNPLLRNGGFEGGSPDGKGGGVPNWIPFELGYLPERQNIHNGEQAIRCDSARTGAVRGAYTTITLNQKMPVSVLISGWSKADTVSGRADSDYAVYADVTYTDGSQLWGQFAAFGTGTHDWERRRVPPRQYSVP